MKKAIGVTIGVLVVTALALAIMSAVFLRSCLRHWRITRPITGRTFCSYSDCHRLLPPIAARLFGWRRARSMTVFGFELDRWYCPTHSPSFAKSAVRPDVDQLERRRDVNGLIKALAYKDDWHVRADSSWVLGELKDKRAVEALIEALKDENEAVRCRAAGALGKIGDARAEGPLTVALKDEDKVTVVWSLFALYKLGDKSTIDELIAALKNEDETVRVAAALTLGELGDRNAIEPLTIASEQSEYSTFKNAIDKIKSGAS